MKGSSQGTSCSSTRSEQDRLSSSSECGRCLTSIASRRTLKPISQRETSTIQLQPMSSAAEDGTNGAERWDEEVASVLALASDARYLAAKDAYVQLMQRLQAGGADAVGEAARQAVVAQLSLDPAIQTMLTRCGEVQKCLQNVSNEHEWIHGMEMLGITTHYRQCPEDKNSIIVKMEGVMDELPVFEQMAVIHELDLYTEWAPLCTKSKLVEKVGKEELFGYLRVGLPLFSRDFLMHAYGVDCLKEEGKVVILGRSTEEYGGVGADAGDGTGEGEGEGAGEGGTGTVPWKELGWFHKRMYVKDFEAVIDVLSPSCAKTRIVSRIDLNAPLPPSMLNFLIRNLAGILLYVLQQQVIKVARDQDCPHAHAMRANTGFYRDWMLPKLRAYCALQGWEQPTVLSLGEEGLPPTEVPELYGRGEAQGKTQEQERTAMETAKSEAETGAKVGAEMGAEIALPL